MGDYIYQGDDPPPHLKRAFDYKAWGVNVFELQPGEVRAVSAAYNIWQAISGYRQAASAFKTSEWSQQNASAFEIVTEYLAERKKRKKHGRS